jgi:hypothetical protein
MKSIFPRNAVISACKQYGPQLKVDSAIDPVVAMMAISSNESSVGANCGPRHEPGYDVGGGIYQANELQRQLVAEYGAAAASSYGPWQMMFINFERGVTPDQLLSDLDLCAGNFVRFFNSSVIGIRKAVSLADIGQVWNGGHVSKKPSPAVAIYCEHLAAAYAQFSTPGPQSA